MNESPEPRYDALLLVSFGGPERPEDVMPFLENVLRGKPVPRERMLEVAEHYYHLGGVSPINEQNRALIAALEAELKAHGPALPIYWGNRNWRPFLADAVRQMAADGVRRALAFFTSAFSSYSGCRQYRENVEQARGEVGPMAPQIDKLRGFFNHPGFIAAMTERVQQALEQVPKARRSDARLVFTAHSIPLAMAANCQYELQLIEASGLVAERAGAANWSLAYQSRSGSPSQPWLEPDIGDVLRQLAAEGASDAVVAPIGFISDHVEVLYDLDTEAQAISRELGLNMVRAPTVGIHPKFVAMIRELIGERMGLVAERRAWARWSLAPMFARSIAVCREDRNKLSRKLFPYLLLSADTSRSASSRACGGEPGVLNSWPIHPSQECSKMPAFRDCLARFGLACLSLAFVSQVAADDWPQWRGPRRDGTWNETGLVEKFSSSELKPIWRAKIGSGYSGPTVADGRVYVTDRKLEPRQIERVHCFDWKTGEPIWMHDYKCEYRGVGYEAGPRASVTIDEGRAYSLGAMGHLFCFDAADGKVLWHKDLNLKYEIRMPIWGIAASPLIEGGLVIVQIGGAGEACLVAFDKVTGAEKWRAIGDEASYSAPIMIEQAGRRVLVCWTGGNVVGLDPSTGKVHWHYPFQPTRMVISIATPVVEGDRLFVSSFYDGSLMLKLDRNQLAVEQIWRRLGPDEKKTDSLHCMIGTPFLEGDYVYGVDSYGELRCLDAQTGDRIWESQKPTPRARWSTIHMVKNHDKYWMFNERGELLISKLSPKGYEEISRAKLIEPTQVQLAQRGGVCWSHPAFAYKHVFARNDEELVAADLSAE